MSLKMQPPSSDPIPLDVVSEILDHVDYRTLKTCAFLSASILPLCHDRLFRKIDLTYITTIRSYLKLYAVLHQRPKISQYVKSLHIHIGNIHGYLGFPCDDPILFNTFSAATNLKHLFVNISALEAYQWHSHATVALLSSLLSLPGVTSVTFSGWHGGTQIPHIPISLLEVPVSLTSLTLERLELWGCLHTNEGHLRGKPVRPSSISIIGCSNFTLKQLFQLSTDPHSPLDLSSLKKMTVSPESNSHYDDKITEDFFRHVFYSLEHLTWKISYWSGTNCGYLEHVDSRHLIHLREFNIGTSFAQHPAMTKDLVSALSVFIGHIPETTSFEKFSWYHHVNDRSWDRVDELENWALDEWKEMSRIVSLPRMEYVKMNVEINFSYMDRNTVLEFERKVRDLLSNEGRLSHQITLNTSTNSRSYSRSLLTISADQRTENGSMEGQAQMERESVGEQTRVKWSVTKRLKRFFLSSSLFRKKGPR